jgi:hypothetical protein
MAVTMPRFRRGLLVASLAALGVASVAVLHPASAGRAISVPIEQLWVDPGDIPARDAFHGIGGEAHVPRTDQEFTVKGFDTTGHSGGFDVRDEAGQEWDVKVGDEAQVEVVASRVLWIIGYHQPIVYFVRDWKAKGAGSVPTSSGRFRLESFHKTEGEWPWRDNPFSGTREFKGLQVANLVLNNWDLKTSNNRVYAVPDEAPGPTRWFVVQDIGAALGKAGWLSGSRNDIEGFEKQKFIDRVEGGVVKFAYNGRHRGLLEGITPADVVWTCGLLDRITDRQWADMFRAATYDPAIADRFHAKLEANIAEGLALGSAAGEHP